MADTDYRKLNALVKKAMRGNKTAFMQLCEKQAPMIIYSCVRYMGSLEDGEDAAQEVFVRMYEKISTLQNPEAFIVWLQKIIVSVCRNMQKKETKNTSNVPFEGYDDLFADDDAGVLPEQWLNDEEGRAEMMAIVNELPERARACIVLFYFDELKISEIAEVLDITEGAVKAQLHIGRNRLREYLESTKKTTSRFAGALLPMGAMTQFFHEDMANLITPDIVSQCMGGIAAASVGASLTGQTIAKSIVAATLATVITVGAIGGFVFYQTFKSDSENNNIQVVPPLVNSDVVLDTGESSADTRIITVHGTVSLVDVFNNRLPDSSTYQPHMEVRFVDADGFELGRTQVESNGIFASILSVETTITHLAAELVFTNSLDFASVEPVSFFSADESTVNISLAFSDVKAPEGEIITIDGDCDCGHVNPTRIDIPIQDSLPTTLTWQFVGEADPSIIYYRGQGGLIENILDSVSSELSDGSYILQVTIFDLAGNTTSLQKPIVFEHDRIFQNQYE